MKLFKKKTGPVFFEEDTLDTKYDAMMVWIKDLSRKDYNRLKKAMDSGYDAYQILHGIEPNDEMNLDNAEFMLSKEDK